MELGHPLHTLYPDELVGLERYSREERDLIERALAFAIERHAGQRRFDGPAYHKHLIAVAQLLVSACDADAETVAAGLLHDTLEDTKTTMEEIAAFGEPVRFLVDAATEVGRGDGARPELFRETREAKTHDKIRRYAREDPRVWLVKGCDRWHNLLTSDLGRVKARIHWSEEAITFHVPGLREAGYAKIADALNDVARDVRGRAQGVMHRPHGGA